MFSITKRFEFEASHKLQLTYDSPCQNLHGHSYKVEITVCGEELDENGMIMDFSVLNNFKQWVMDNWDHATIIPREVVTDSMREHYGNIYEFEYHNVTAELMCKRLHEKACEILGLSDKEVVITIYETTNNCATYSV